MQGMTTDEIISDYFILIQGRGDPEPDENTVLDPALIERLIKDLENPTSIMPIIVHYDKKNNTIRDGIKYRKA